MSTNPVTPPSGANEQAAASLVSFVVDTIIDGVMKGHYVQGQRLIAADLAEEFNVSRAPVREALHMLAGEGVIELIANRGARIRRLSVEDLIDFLEFTEAICVLGVRLATGQMSNADSCYAANQAFQQIEEAYTRKHNRDFVEALYRYHIELNRLSGNQFLEFFYQRPYIRFYTILLSDLAPGKHWEQYILNYRMIHDMILSGDAHSAVISFVGHIRWVLRNMRNDGSA